MTPSIDIGLYIIAAVLFIFAGFDVHFGKPPPGWTLRWDALAFAVLTISLIV